MKISKLQIERFKRFAKGTLDFTDPSTGTPLDLIVLIGENGSGKSSLLQAIASTLAVATRQLKHPSDLHWPGYTFPDLNANYRGFASVTAEMVFSEDEIAATRRFAQNGDLSNTPNFVTPGDSRVVKLAMTNDTSLEKPVTAKNAREMFQFSGRYYALKLLNRPQSEENMFEQVGGLFWYNEQRTSHSSTPFEDNQSLTSDNNNKISSEDRLRLLLMGWVASEPDKVTQLNEYYKRLFVGRALNRVGKTVGNELIAPIFFIQNDDQKEYEIGEFSAGERSLFPILVDFIQWRINHSVILIDELELHLHPPLQQSLLYVLPQLGIDNQIILTTHSDWIADLVPEESIRRIPQDVKL